MPILLRIKTELDATTFVTLSTLLRSKFKTNFIITQITTKACTDYSDSGFALCDWYFVPKCRHNITFTFSVAVEPNVVLGFCCCGYCYSLRSSYTDLNLELFQVEQKPWNCLPLILVFAFPNDADGLR